MAVEERGLLERSRELARLRELIDAARDRRGAVAVLEGPAGVGKTSLLAAAAEMAQANGLRCGHRAGS
jgi:DNA replication protein DnaC